jgi:hypothetical protein
MDEQMNSYLETEYFDLLDQVIAEPGSRGTSERNLLAGQAHALLNGYLHRLTKSFADTEKGLAELEQKKKKLSVLVQAHPKLKKTGVRFTFGMRTAIIRPPGLLDVFEEYQQHLKKVNEALVMLEKEHREILIEPILQDLTPPCAMDRAFLEPLD